VTTVAAGEQAAPAPRTTWLDRLVAAVPLLSVFFWLCILYAWEAHNHASPWLFSDELELAQLSRAIAETGHAARRGQAHSFDTLYAFLIAPAWRIHSTSEAYAVVKYIGVFTMTSAVFPAYFLARTLVSRNAALFVAAAAGMIPALAYAPILIPEPLAYPYAVLCFFLIARALARRSRGWIAAAVAASVVAPLVRGQLAIVPVVFLLAAGIMLWTSERGRRWRASWSLWDWVGAFVLAASLLVLLSASLGTHSHTWLVSTSFYPERMIEYGLWAAGSLVIGVGLLPAVAGLAALAGARGEPRSAELRAFTALVLAAIVCFGLYTANKAAYLSTVFATLVEERNLVYLSPLLFVGTALWIDRPRLRPLPLLAATGLVAFLILHVKPYQLRVSFYADAPGLAIAQMANRDLSFDADAVMWTLYAALGVAVLLLVLPQVLERCGLPGARTVVLVALGLVLAWSLAGELRFANGSNSLARRELANFPSPPDWLDRLDGGQPALYLGQKVQDPTGENLLEFWNRSLRYVWSLDGTAPRPGPTLTPDLAATNGRLYPDPGVRWVVAEPGIDVRGTVAAREGTFTLYRLSGPLGLAHSQTGVFADGWIGCAYAPCPVAEAAYNQYSTHGDRPGEAIVTVSRAAANGAPIRPGHVLIRLGTLIKGSDRQPHIGRVTAVRSWAVRAGAQRTFTIPTPKPPFRVEVSISPTFSPSDYGSSDRRSLGAQVAFSFSSRRPGR
jgi:hypothetical protein